MKDCSCSRASQRLWCFCFDKENHWLKQKFLLLLALILFYLLTAAHNWFIISYFVKFEYFDKICLYLIWANSSTFRCNASDKISLLLEFLSCIWQRQAESYVMYLEHFLQMKFFNIYLIFFFYIYFLVDVYSLHHINVTKYSLWWMSLRSSLHFL